MFAVFQEEGPVTDKSFPSSCPHRRYIDYDQFHMNILQAHICTNIRTECPGPNTFNGLDS